MKTMNAILATVTIGASALLFTGNAYAGDEMNVTPSSSEKKAIVELKSPKSIDASIFVTDVKGDVIHKENIKSQTSYGRVYDFSNLEDGIYTIISNTDYIKTTKEVKVEKSSIEILNSEVEYKPIFSTKGTSLRVNYLNKDSENIKFSIERGNAVFYESTEGSEISFQKMVNISSMPRGEYYASVKVGGKTYSHSFDVK